MLNPHQAIDVNEASRGCVQRRMSSKDALQIGYKGIDISGCYLISVLENINLHMSGFDDHNTRVYQLHNGSI